MGRRCWTLRLLMLILGHILLVINQAGSSHADKTIRMGYLMQYVSRAGAINVAIEQAQNDGLLRGYNFRYFANVCSVPSRSLRDIILRCTCLLDKFASAQCHRCKMYPESTVSDKYCQKYCPLASYSKSDGNWNNLPEDSTNFSSLALFKRCLNSNILVRHCKIYYF